MGGGWARMGADDLEARWHDGEFETCRSQKNIEPRTLNPDERHRDFADSASNAEPGLGIEISPAQHRTRGVT